MGLTAKIKSFILIAGDILILYLALLATLYLRYQADWPLQWQRHFYPFTIIYFLWLLSFYIIGLYDLRLARNNFYFFVTLTKAIIINAGLAIAFFYFIPYFGITPKTNLFINIAFLTTLFVGWRQFYNRFIKTPALLNNVLIIGQNPEINELIKHIRDNPQLGYRIKKITELGKVKILHDLINIVAKEKIRLIITTINPRKNAELARNLYQCIPLKIAVADLPAFYEKITGKVPVSVIEEIWFLENLMSGQKTIYEGVKRLIDIVAAVIGGFFTILITPLVFLLIKLDGPGPFLYRYKRVGRDNRIFEVIKFRTMVTDAEKDGAQRTKKDDSRRTRVGKFLKKTRINELPQLWNVLKGDMTFVGPRPERPEFAFAADLLEKIPFYQIRHTIKPGLTGWAQIKFPYGSSVEDTLQKLQYDLYYIKNRSFILDIAIILKTVKTILSGGGK